MLLSISKMLIIYFLCVFYAILFIIIIKNIQKLNLNIYGNDDHITPTKRTVPIHIILGPIGLGKSTFGRLLVDYLNTSIKAVYIDGDELMGLSLQNTMKLGQERNPCTIYSIVDAIAHGYTPVISTGGGALCADKYKNIKDTIQGMIPVNVELHLYFPSYRVQEFTPDVPHEFLDLNNLYCNPETEKYVKHAINQRLLRNEWICKIGMTIIAFCKYIYDLSCRNLKFANTLVELSSSTSVFPAITFETFNTMSFAGMGINLPKQRIINIIGEPSIVCKQVRILASVSGNYGHFTSEYYQRPLPVLCSLLDNFSLLRYRVLPSIIVTAMSGKNTIKFAMPIDICAGIHINPENDESAHVTMNSGEHAADLMRNVATAIRNGETTITLPTKIGNENITYALNPLEEYQHCEITLHGVFCL